MKHIALVILCLSLLSAAASGCSQTSVQAGTPADAPAGTQASTPADTPASDKLSVVCTIFPQYDWTRRILGENANNFELTMLLNNGVDLHSFQPSVNDIIKISACDVFIYVGGESDAWVEDALKEAENPNMAVINLLDVLGDNAKIEVVTEGMQDDEEHEHSQEEEPDETHAEEHGEEPEEEHIEEPNEEHIGEPGEGHVEEHEDEHEAVYDEHVWLSLKNAEIFCEAITGALSSLDAENAGDYQNNMDAYIAELEMLDTEYRRTAESTSAKTLLFCDRFPFRYLTDDYGFDYYAAFPGCSAETEASFDTVMFLAEKASELNLNAVMVTESSDKSIAETVISSTDSKDQQIYTLNSLQSVTQNDVESGETYLSIMENNLKTLAEVLD